MIRYLTPCLLSGSVLPFLAGCAQSAKQADAAGQTEKPNVIYLIADDLGIGDLSCYGATRVSTPHLDSLAAQGLQFSNAYATSSTSTPSRFGLLTGMYPWRQENTGIAPGNSELIIPNAQDIGFDYEFVIPATVDRVPCVFVENGRVVGLDPDDPITVSYEHKVGDWPTGEENPELVKMKPSQGHNNTIINGIPRIGWMTGGKSALWVDEDIADVITGKAKAFIAAHKDEPFFLYMGTQDVHVPRVPHPRFAGKSGMGPRGDVILQLDWTVGEIMHTLDSLGIADNTILVFCSDNGPVIDDGYQDRALELLNGHKPMLDYRGGKYSAYEAGTRTPFLVRWPARIKPGKQDALFSMIDVYASLAALLGHELPQGVAPDSRNRLDTFLGTDTLGCNYVVQQNLNNTLSVIQGDWKYIEPSDKPAIEFWTKMELGNDLKPQLYNLSSDPGEKNNVAADYPEKVETLSALLKRVKDGEMQKVRE